MTDHSSHLPRLQLTGISKRYASVLANDQIALQVLSGEIHAVLGENGAGKSTLMKIIYGAVQPDSGAVWFNGQPVSIRQPQQARALGISMVYQHFSLFDTLTVAENIWLGLDPGMSLSEVVAGIEAKASAYGLELDPRRLVHTLSVGEMQRVEIVRALLSEPQLLILDEPTSVLAPSAVETLFGVLRQLASQGCSILYISHKLHEIRALCHSCTVLRAGRVSGRCDPRQLGNAELSELMIGASPVALRRRPKPRGPLRLSVDRLSMARDDPFGVDLHQVSLQLHAGEIVGIAGVSGNGQQALLRLLSGEDGRRGEGGLQISDPGESGRMLDMWAWGPVERRQRGLHTVPEERLGRGAVPALSLAHNLLLTRREAMGWGGWLKWPALQSQARAIIERFGVRAAGPQALAQSLSGGNLQKFIVGREVGAQPRVLLVAQPTWGVDVGAAAQIRAELLALRDAGCAVLLISDELDELLALSDRLHVMARGRLSPPLATEQASAAVVGEWMSGLWPVQAPTPVEALA